MKIFTRIAAAVTAALVSVFVATPALAQETGEKFNPADQFSAAGQPVDTVAILIVGAVLLVVILVTAQLVGNLFEKSGK
ncbi:hypothetical protein QBL02_07205 [Leucobacter sp. UT-8R-CII-1-4]|uniref:hypothetical protein n=1 Tax=Leucobacter sp. UT-8R-CII-1-4 TaxID=3040075 RepID=UPI0024A80F3F|nr:hypothetical protein [Leucobacter sp. UT-8R-CII-1-4]MDI6023330.1 hypothetical protein [Leucobacter sp. UT-8R-CII-1-4]